MAKHKIVQFTNGVAKVSITDDFRPHLDKENNETFFINPDLGFVKGIPPEFWTVKEGKIWPIEDVQHLQKRVDILNIQSEVPTKSDETLIEDFLDQIIALQENAEHLRGEVSNLETHTYAVEVYSFKVSNKMDQLNNILEDKINTLDFKQIAEKEELRNTLEMQIAKMASEHGKAVKVLGILLAIALAIAILK